MQMSKDSGVNEKRSKLRIPIRISAHQIKGDQTNEVVVKDVSETGVKLAGAGSYEKGDPISIALQIMGREIPVEGKVKWTSKGHSRTAENSKESYFEIGVRFENTPDELKEATDMISQNFENRRNAPRLQTSQAVNVENLPSESGSFCENISVTGMFLVTENIYPKGTPVDLNIQLEGASTRVRVRGKVVRAITPDISSANFTSSGMGIQFEEFKEDSEKMLAEFLEKSKEFLPEAPTSSNDEPETNH